ncbi:MAG: hypothetical protein HWE26_18860 [Alteromonadaceae bacterium]|nr:hypothetical protein [Alteromonadaceae bacterium]
MQPRKGLCLVTYIKQQWGDGMRSTTDIYFPDDEDLLRCEHIYLKYFGYAS